MAPYDFAKLENAEFDACIDLYRAVPEEIRVAQAVEVHEVGAETCMSCRGIEPASLFRRAVGLGVGRAATPAELDDVLAHMNARVLRYAIPVAEASQPAALASWLEARGFTRGYAWMKFCRACDDPPHVETALDIRVVGRDSAAAFGHVVAEGFGLPPLVAPWVGALAGRPNWICVMAFAEGVPVAAGAVHVRGDHAWLGLAATLPSHRGHGAQGALLARRIAEAKARGARVAVTETGERLPDKPSNSYRNILRAGFEEAYLRQNYLSPATPG